MSTPRNGPTAILLPSGKVLVFGGTTCAASPCPPSTSSAELYDPAAGTWSPTGSLLQMPTTNLLGGALLQTGKVLAVGHFAPGVTMAAELYDPTIGTWTTTGSPTQTFGSGFSTTLLSNGKVLIAGGAETPSSANLYDPQTGTWSVTGAPIGGQAQHTAVLLANGQVLIAGGGSGGGITAQAQLYDPATGVWSFTGNMSTARVFNGMALLPSGKVLVAGGGALGTVTFNSAEVYDPAAGTWSPTGSMANSRLLFTLTVLPDGTVLAAGGSNFTTGNVGPAELYDSTTGTWSTTGSLNEPRDAASTTLLPDGRVLVAGGLGNAGTAAGTASAELYTPQAVIVDSSITAAGMTVAATEGSPFTGTVATFADPDTAGMASEYSATIDWGDGSPVDTGVITGGSGSFSVSGTHTYSEEATDAVTVTITDVDNASNRATANSTANVADATLRSSCATPPVSSTAFSGNVANLTDANPFATTSDFTATINWGDGSSSAGVITGGPGNGPYTVSGTHTYATPGFYVISTTINDHGSSVTVTCGNKTFVFPPSTAGCDIDGTGKIKAANGDKANFTVDAEVQPNSPNDNDEDEGNNEDKNDVKNVQTYRDLGPATPFKFKSTQISSVTCNDHKSGSIYGSGTVDGTTPVFFIIDVTAGSRDDSDRGRARNEDEGSPATYRIRLSNGYDSGQQQVRSGGIDIQIEVDRHDGE